jgi:hypothetical protein
MFLKIEIILLDLIDQVKFYEQILVERFICGMMFDAGYLILYSIIRV